jgi:DnaJ-class molecular chaperone
MLSKNIKNYNFYKLTKRFLKDYDPNKDYYKILGITKQSTDKEIKASYYKLAKQFHPDVNQGKTNEKFKEMSAAYDILSDPVKRREYDASRSLNSFFSGKQYSSSSHNTNSNNTYQNTNYRTYDDPFKNMNDFFKNFYQKNQQQQNYKSNFNDKPKDFRSKYYSKNKEYFSSFKKKEDEPKSYEESPKKSGNDFSKKYFEKNKKYYDTFKKPKDENENRHNSSNYTDNTSHTTDSQSGALYFILTFFGIFLGSIIVHSIFNSGKQRQSSQHSQPYQQPKPITQSYSQQNQSGEYIYQDPYANKKL